MNIDHLKKDGSSLMISAEMSRYGVSVTHLTKAGLLRGEYQGVVRYIDPSNLQLGAAPFSYIFENRWKGKCLMEELGFSVPMSGIFGVEEVDRAKRYAKKVGFPILVKTLFPPQDYASKGLIHTEDELVDFLGVIGQKLGQKHNVLLEKQAEGSSYIVVMTRNGFFSAAEVVGLNVMGDGKKSLGELMEQKFQSNSGKKIALSGLDSEIKKYLSNQRLTPSFVPKKGEKVALYPYITTPFFEVKKEVSSKVHPFYKEIFFSVFKKVPGLSYVEFFLTAKDLCKEGAYVISEADVSPRIPFKAISDSKASGAIASLLFPEASSKLFSPNIKVLKNKQFKTLPKLSRYFQDKQKKNWFFKPVMLELELTNLCNLRCKGCAIIEDVKKGDLGLSADMAIDVLRQAAEIGLYCYSLTGGEPFTRLEDVLRIIEACPEMDCYKIQTNGTIFRTDEVTVALLNKLKNSGFGSRNKYISSSLRCSVGMQDGERGVDFFRTCHLGDNFFEVFDRDKANLAFILTHSIEKNPVEARDEFLQKYQSYAKKPFDSEGVHIRTLFLHSAPGLKKEESRLPKLPLREFLKEYAKDWECFDNKKADTPWPKLLVRANGAVYTCSCFGHVFYLGNIKESSLMELIEVANANRLFALIEKKGLMGFLEEAERVSPELGQKSIPITASVCQVCRLMKGAIDRYEKRYPEAS